MSLTVRLCLNLVILTCVYNAAKGAADTEKPVLTVDAAVGFRDARGLEWVYLYVGDLIHALINKEYGGVTRRLTQSIPDGFPLTAGFLKDSRNHRTRYYYGEKYGYLIFVSGSTKVKKFKYGPKRKFIRNGGPDAAARRNGIVYIFKGCKMAIRHSWNRWELAFNDVKTIGLPCNADAAWGETEGAMVVLKGDQVWRWETDDSVSGPHAFHDTYDVDNWVLKPSEESK